MVVVGVVLAAGAAGWLAWRFRAAERRRPFPGYGWLGLAVVAGAGAGLGLRLSVITTFVTAIFWTGYVLVIDAAVYSVRGRRVRGAGWMALLSIPLWLVFEAYNLRLRNWQYIGLPENPVVRIGGYLWAFATIWPAILETAEFLRGTEASSRGSGAGRCEPLAGRGSWMIVTGAAMLIVPLVAPVAYASYLFGFVWIGFALLLDPLNARAGRPSVMAEPGRLWALLGAGMVCGIFWEFWNYWAAAKWVYVFPIGQSVKIFEMPLAGYLGFPAFGVEVFAMYVFFAGLLRVPDYEVA